MGEIAAAKEAARVAEAARVEAARVQAEMDAKVAAEAAEEQAYLDSLPDTQPQASPVSSNAAKAFIYDHESGNEPCKINGGAIDCNYTGDRACGLGQAYPCSKLRAVCSLSDYACQDAFFDSYAVGRYGSWEGAYAFWISNNWW